MPSRFLIKSDSNSATWPLNRPAGAELHLTGSADLEGQVHIVAVGPPVTGTVHRTTLTAPPLLLQDGIEVVGEAENGAAALRAARALRPDVVCMDVRMPETDGIEGTASKPPGWSVWCELR